MLLERLRFPPAVAPILPREIRKRGAREILAADAWIEMHPAALLAHAQIELVILVGPQALRKPAPRFPCPAAEAAGRHGIRVTQSGRRTQAIMRVPSPERRTYRQRNRFSHRASGPGPDVPRAAHHLRVCLGESSQTSAHVIRRGARVPIQADDDITSRVPNAQVQTGGDGLLRIREQPKMKSEVGGGVPADEVGRSEER